MKNIFRSLYLFLVAVSMCLPVFGQAGGVFTVAGGGTSTADGVPATNASLNNISGIAADAAGNVYVVDRSRYVVRKINSASGLIHTIAGTNGVSGYSGDGGPASLAKFSNGLGGVHVTASGDVYIADNTRVRKIDIGTGIITTVAGGGSSFADGIPATSAALAIQHVFVDSVDNIYVGTSERIKRIDVSTGIITTIAGGGTSTADGVPATAALINGTARSICMDNAGNLYIVGGHDHEKVRKIDATTGLIHSVAGGGISSAEGVPATNMILDGLHSCRVDGAGNIFLADWFGSRVRRVDAGTGLVNTIAGCSSICDSLTEGAAATSVALTTNCLWLNTFAGMVYSNHSYLKVKRFSYSPMVTLHGAGTAGLYASDSLYVNIDRRCSGPEFTVRTRNLYPGMTIRTYFGDGSSDTSVVGVPWSGGGGYVRTSVVYPASGTYSVMHVLCNSGIPVDTLSYSYNHIFCSQLSLYMYHDADGDCSKDAAENFLMRSSVTEIDSNGVPVDTIVATSGFTYQAYGAPGDVYRFKILSTPAGLVPSCPATGILYDTLMTGVNENPARFAAISCSAPTTSDLAIVSIDPRTRPNEHWGHIYVRNNGCVPTDASVTLNFSPKYMYTGGAIPTPSSTTATSLTWSLAGLSSLDLAPVHLHFFTIHNPAYSYPVDGDTVNNQVTVTSLGGVTDVHSANNMIIVTDTVNTSVDPNEIVVSPSCFDTDTTFHFTVHFENIGSAPAENIYVMDTLSPWFDASTIDIEMSTHTMFTSKQVANGLTIYRFNFPNINLADSSDHANRDGAFMYTIKNKPGIPTGVIARSRVGIYFDYNDVLLTNTVDNRKGCPVTSVETVGIQQDVALFPNPTSGTLTIQTSDKRFSELVIANAIGQQLLQRSMMKSEQTIDVSHLPAGVYYLTLRGNEGNEVRKFVKW